jgi:hypothetical protein
MLTLSLLASGLLIACGGGLNAGPPNTALFEGFQANPSNEGREALLRERVSRLFPVGGPESGLEQYLRLQGFETKRRSDAPAQGQPIYGDASVRYGPGACKMRAHITWRGDAAGNLTEFTVWHGGDGCI